VGEQEEKSGVQEAVAPRFLWGTGS